MLSTFHARVECIFVQKYALQANGQKSSETAPSPWGSWTLSNTRMPTPTALTNPNDSLLSHNYATKSPFVTMGRLKFIPKTTHSPSTITSPSNTPIPRPTPLTTQTASGSIQPFCHSTLSRQTDRQTHRPTDGTDDRSTPLALTLAVLIDSDALETFMSM